MDTGNIRLWHIGVGLPLVLLALVWAYAQNEPGEGRTTSPLTFQREVRAPAVGKKNPQPIVSDVRLYPPVDGVYTVTYLKLVAIPEKEEWRRQPWSFSAKSVRGAKDFRGQTEEPVPEFLARLKSENASFSYTYEWWREPTRLWRIYYGVSATVFTCFTLVPLGLWISKGGLKEFSAKQNNPEVVDGHIPATAGGAGRVVSEDDQARLTAMIDRLESEHAPGQGTPSHGTAHAGVAVATAGAPRILDGKPLDTSATALAEDEEKKDFKGEFYPVARAAAPKKEE